MYAFLFFFVRPKCTLADSERAIEMNPANLKAYVRKASACVELNKIEEAKKAVSKYLELDPDKKYISKDLLKLVDNADLVS